MMANDKSEPKAAGADPPPAMRPPQCDDAAHGAPQPPASRSSTTKIRVSEPNAAALLQILLERGYFHPPPPPRAARGPEAAHRNIAAASSPSSNNNNHNKAAVQRQNYYDPRDALLVPRNNSNNDNNSNDGNSAPSSSYITLERLAALFGRGLRQRGRWRLDAAAASLGVSAELVRERVVPRVAGGASSNDKYTLLCTGSDHAVVTEVVTAEHLQQQLDGLLTGTQLREGGRVPVSEAAALLDLPPEVALRALEETIASAAAAAAASRAAGEPSSSSSTSFGSGSVQILLDDHASKVLVHRAYLDRLQSDLKQVLVEADTPVDIAAVARERGWEVSWVRRLLSEFRNDNDNILPGQFQGEETFVPYQYTQRLQRSVRDMFAANGYVTAHACLTLLNIGPHQMKEYVLAGEDGEDDSTAALVLEHSVLHRIAVVAPLVAALQDVIETTQSASAASASSNNGWLDLQLHLPSELLDYHIDDARRLIEEHVLVEQLSSEGGTAVGLACVRTDGALFFSRALMEDFAKNHVSELVRDYAQSRAKELSEAEHESGSTKSRQRRVSEDETTMTAKEKRKARKASKAKHDNEDETVTVMEYGMVSFDTILQRLLEVYPDLSDLGDTSGESVLAELCRTAFYTDSLEDQCREAVVAEMDRLSAEKRLSISKSSSTSRKGGLGDFATIDAAFEDPGCFSNACFMIQAKAKSMDYLVKNSDPPLDDASKEALEKDLLTGCCADFTRRITEFALYKNNAEDHAFTFLFDEKAPDSDFFSPIDLGSRLNSKIYISSGQRDPLPLLREELPGSVGIALARQWILCGGECYKGGEKSSSVGEESYVRPGDVDGFLAHVHENCLPVCGLPFTKLDKRNEKKFLNARRQRLVLLLEETADVATALDLAIMLLYQLAKNLVVSGAPSLLRGPILQLLTRERKVSETVSAELTAVAEKIEKGEALDADQLERIRDCVLAKPKS